MPIRVTCQCGKGFQAPDSLAGKAVKCPACGSALPIPKPGDSDIFTDLGDLANLEAAANQASSSGVGGALSSGTTGGGSLQMGSGGRKSSPPIVAIVAGAFIALACVVLIIVLIYRGSSRGQRREVDKSGRPETSSEDRGSSAESEGTDGGENGSPTNGSRPQDDDGEKKPRGGLEGILGQLLPKPPGTDGEADNGGTGTEPDNSVSGGVRAKSQSMLKKGILKWYAQDELVASRPIEDISVRELHYGWMVELLPYLGYQEDYDKLDFEKPWPDEPNDEIARKVIPEFLNPADGRKEYAGFQLEGLGLTHFVGMSGVEDGRNVTAAKLERSDPRAGIFGYTEIARREDITDGRGKTIMLIGSGKLAGPWIVSGGSTIRGARLSKDGSYFHEMYGFGSLGYEKKGAIALMADGTVRWIPADIDEQVFRAFCTIHGDDEVDMAALRADFDATPASWDAFRPDRQQLLPISPRARGLSFARPAGGPAGQWFLPRGGDRE